MDQALIIPAATLVISLGSLIYTQWQAAKAKERDQRIDDRAAAKDTVDSLARLNEALGRDIADLRDRVEHIEQKLDECERERNQLLVERDVLRAQLAEAKRG